MSSMADLVAKLVIKGDSSSAVRELTNLERKVNATLEVIKRLDNGLRTVQGIASGGLLAMGGALTVIAREGNKAWNEVEDLNRSLTTLLKSKAEADRATAEIMKFAGSAPFKVSDINEASKYLLANGATVEQLTNKYKGLLRVFGDVAATMSSEGKQLSLMEVASLYERAQQGQLRANMLLQVGLTKADLAKYGAQFDDNGQIIKQLGLPTEQAMQNVADALVKAFQDKFSGGMERLAGDDSGLAQILKNRVQELLRPLGEEIDKQWEAILRTVNDGLKELAGDPALGAGLKEVVRQAADLAKPEIARGIQFVRDLVAYLKQNPQALAEALNRLVGIVKALGTVLLVVTGVRGLLFFVQTGAQVVVAVKAINLAMATWNITVGALALNFGVLTAAIWAAYEVWQLFKRDAAGIADLQRQNANNRQQEDTLGTPREHESFADVRARASKNRAQNLIDKWTQPGGLLGAKVPWEPQPTAGASGIPGAGSESDAAKKAREKAEADVRGQAVELIKGREDVARLAAAATLGRTDNLCAATTGEYLKMWGLDVPKFATTADVVKWLKSAGAQQVKPGDVKPGDVVFARDLTDTMKGGGPNGIPDHVGIALGAATGGRIAFQDQRGAREEGLKYFGSAYRLPIGMLGSAIQGAPAEDPLQQAFAAAYGEVDQLRRKLALYREGLATGVTTREQLNTVEKELRDAQAKLFEQLKTSLSNQDFARLQQAQPEFIADLFQAWSDSQGEARLEQFAASVKTAQEKFDALAQQVDALRSGLRGLEDSYAGLRSSRAKAQGHGLEALAIDADTALRQVYRGVDDVERFRNDDAARAGKTKAQLATEEAQLLTTLATAMKGAYDMVAALKGTEGAGGLAKDLMERIEPLYQKWGPQIDQFQQSAGQVLTSAGYQLQAAAAALQAAASALASAAAAARDGAVQSPTSLADLQGVGPAGWGANNSAGGNGPAAGAAAAARNALRGSIQSKTDPFGRGHYSVGNVARRFGETTTLNQAFGSGGDCGPGG